MQYLQIAFDKPQPMYGVIMQGNPIFDQYVTSFKILHSSDGIAFHYLVDETTHPQVFTGPIDSRTPVKSMFKIPIEAKVIRIYPLTWHGSIAIRAELLGCSLEKINLVIPHHEEIPVQPMCDDPLGVTNGNLRPEQIRLSSTKGTVSPIAAAESLKLNAPQGWQPNVDSLNEYVLFDFREPRNVTGIETKGGKRCWVTAYNVLFTNDFVIWNALQTDDGTPKVFIGNVDSASSKVNHFKYPIQTTALKLVPIKWNECIELKAEPIGCFLPYPVPHHTVDVVVQNDTQPVECGVCVNVANAASPIEGTCRCYAPLYWNGAECVAKSACPCTDGLFTYGVGAVYERDDCFTCTCGLGGIAQCSPRKCPPCGEGLRRTTAAPCSCQCEPCPDGKRLCPSSGECIAEASWCDGIVDCQDDEVECSKKGRGGSHRSKTKITKIIKETTVENDCPEPTCPPGFTIKYIESKPRKQSPMLQTDGNEVEVYQKPNAKQRDKKRRNKTAKEAKECQEFECIPIRRKTPSIEVEAMKCTQPTCPIGYEIVADVTQMTAPGQCAKYKCEPLPQSDAVCNATGRTFNTFDGIEFKYDICDHIMARDFYTKNWTISREFHYLLSFAYFCSISMFAFSFSSEAKLLGRRLRVHERGDHQRHCVRRQNRALSRSHFDAGRLPFHRQSTAEVTVQQNENVRRVEGGQFDRFRVAFARLLGTLRHEWRCKDWRLYEIRVESGRFVRFLQSESNGR